MRLQERVAIVTGGGGGMGGGICRRLAEAGADIVVSDINLAGAQGCAETVEGLGRRVLVVESDITKAADCALLVERTLEAFGQLDIIVNNAGHFGGRLGNPFTNLTEEEWDDNYGINVKGPFFLCKAAAPHMIERKYGKIINISSVATKRDPTFVPAYVATKNGLLSLTRVLAKELGPHNINVNAICPGFVWTNFWHTLGPLLAADDDNLQGLDGRAVFEHFVKSSVPLQREQKPEDIGDLAVFLASEESRNITGQTINVDGGVAMG